jgi:uncharacterized protein CbrC (UPF0167 family)
MVRGRGRNGLDADDRCDATCRSCGSTVAFPEPLKAKKQRLACYECLRAGRAAMSKSTEFRLVTWAHAAEGITGGMPELRAEQFERVLIDPDEDWYGVHVPAEHLWELLRTPGFHSWQDEPWLFCCQRPMIDIGGWRNVMGSSQPDDAKGFCEGLFDPDDEVEGWIWERADEGDVSLYVYRCGSCSRLWATWDSD